LVDETGQVLREDKRGAIKAKTAKIMSRLHVGDENWLKLTTNFEGIFTGAVGTAEHLCEFIEHVGLDDHTALLMHEPAWIVLNKPRHYLY